MVNIFSKFIEEALDELAPIKTFTIRSHYKFGLTDKTKELMHERDVTRGRIKYANSTSEKQILQSKYKALRNKVTRNIRQDNVDFNNNRVAEANSEAEMWKVANEVNNPKKSNEWTILIDGKKEMDELKIAEAFNQFFITKIADLKDGIGQSIKVDPLERLEKKMAHNTCKFNLKPITEANLTKIMKQMKRKRVLAVTV